MITCMEAYNYRCFRAMSVTPDEYQVLAGANGAGKTTLLDIPPLFQDMLQGRRVDDAFLRLPTGRRAPRAHTFTELLHHNQGKSFGFTIEARLPDDIAALLSSRSDASPNGAPPTHLRYAGKLRGWQPETPGGRGIFVSFPREREQARPGSTDARPTDQSHRAANETEPRLAADHRANAW